MITLDNVVHLDGASPGLVKAEKAIEEHELDGDNGHGGRETVRQYQMTNVKNYCIVFTGGQCGRDTLAAAHAFDLRQEKFRPLPPMNEARYSHSATSVGDKVFVACGNFTK